MPRILLVTNDFPPTIGGIQSYLRDFLATLDPADVLVFASTQDAEAAAAFDAQLPYEVIRWPRRMMLPTPATRREMQRIIDERGIEIVWFGAAAPLALMGGAAKAAGARKVVATTHGHEVGWSMLPGARHALRDIGKHADVITFIAEYTLRRLRPAFGPGPDWVHLPSGVNTDMFEPVGEFDMLAAGGFYGLEDADPVIVCVSRFVPRKGQDQLLRVMPRIRERYPKARLLLIGRGRYQAALEQLAEMYAPETIFHEAANEEEIAMALAAADIFAMPARTRGGGLDVEGLGIVYLEAQAAGLPVIAGDSGGAPETVTPETGIVVRGNSQDELAQAILTLLGDPNRACAMGRAGRRHVEENWTWEIMGARLRAIMA